MSKNPIDPYEYENNFYWHSHPTRLAKILGQYDLYKRILDLPGHIIEMGVFKGASFIRLATFRRCLENDDSRALIGFDSFGKFPTHDDDLVSDRQFTKYFEEKAGEGLAKDEINSYMVGKGFSNYVLVQGDIFKTLPSYIEEQPQLRVALLHLDMDIYQPTRFALDMLFDRIVPGGLIMIDDYNIVEGATLAIDELTSKHGLSIKKNSFYTAPSFIKKA